MKSHIELKLVCVEWIDAHTTTGWQTAASVLDPPELVSSVGWVLSDEPDHVILAQSADSGDNVNNTIAIPRAMIRRVMPLGDDRATECKTDFQSVLPLDAYTD